jgi:IS1 family transposase
VFGRRQDEVFLQLKALLEPFGITRFFTDHWGAYTRHLAPEAHVPGKCNTQQIERKHLTLRTRVKRLARKTICFSRPTKMHDLMVYPFWPMLGSLCEGERSIPLELNRILNRVFGSRAPHHRCGIRLHIEPVRVHNVDCD